MVSLLLAAVLPLCALSTMPPTDRLPLADISQVQLDSFARLSQASSSFDPSQHSLALLRSSAPGLSAITQNDIVEARCKPVTLLFARGTTEDGNMGSLVGPLFAQALGKAVGPDNLAVQGVDYSASIQGFLGGGDADGSKTMAGLVAMVKSNCANTSLVLAGYSQGGQLVHKAASMLSASETSFVRSAVIFGDPNNGKSVGRIDPSKTKIICHNLDMICEGQKFVTGSHLTYWMNVGEAAVSVVKSGVL